MDEILKTLKVYGVTQDKKEKDVLVFVMAVTEYCEGVGVSSTKKDMSVRNCQVHQAASKEQRDQPALSAECSNKRIYQCSDPGDFMFNNRPLFKKNFTEQGTLDGTKRIWRRRLHRRRSSTNHRSVKKIRKIAMF